MDSLRSTRLFVCTTLLVVTLLGIVAAGTLSPTAAYADEGDGLLQDVSQDLYGDDNVDLPEIVPVYPLGSADSAGYGWADAWLEAGPNDIVVSWAEIQGFAEETMN